MDEIRNKEKKLVKDWKQKKIDKSKNSPLYGVQINTIFHREQDQRFNYSTIKDKEDRVGRKYSKESQGNLSNKHSQMEKSENDMGERNRNSNDHKSKAQKDEEEQRNNHFNNKSRDYRERKESSQHKDRDHSENTKALLSVVTKKE